MKRKIAAVTVIYIFTFGCHKPASQISDTGPQVEKLDGLGHHMMAITTTSPEAQDMFNQGLTWTYAFNHDEAIRAFEAAARHDPNCAMAYWGIALCHGPHVNNPVLPNDRAKAAWAAVEKARAVKNHASYPEQQLIEAVAARYSADCPADRKHLDEAYAAAMRQRYSMDINDADIGTLYAEALMDLQPWDYWARDGSPMGSTSVILALLDHVLRINPNHPGANHLYIHMVEASNNPERGIASADRLRDMVPLSGHLIHMPSHIDVQVGQWARASDMNEKAIAADTKYRAMRPRQGFYNMYMAHNRHFLTFSCMMEGRGDAALKAAQEMLAAIPPDFIENQPAFADPFLTIEFEVLKRFGRWDDVLKLKKPRGQLPISMAQYHYARGVAYAAKDKVDKARDEQREFLAAKQRVPKDALTGINNAHKVLSIAERVLEGEIAFREKRIDDAVAKLREAVTIEDDLLYMEPPEWILPVRHALGAVLVNAGRHAEAEQVYRDDLKNWPENGWSLKGLATCQAARGASVEAEATEERLAKSWARADIKPGASCLCVADSQQSR